MKLLKGLNKDSDPIDQPEGTYLDARNILLTKKKGALSSEEGNIARDNIPADHRIIGSSSIYDGRYVLFLAGVDNSNDGGTDQTGSSEIGVFDGETYSTIVNDTRLNFKVDNENDLEAVTIINNKDEVVVYWTDNVNPPRFYNISDDNAGTIDNIEDLRIFSTIQQAPVIELNDVQSGGQLLTGAYHFAIRYIAEDDSMTGYMSLTPAVYITDDSNVDNPDDYDGSDAGVQSGKSIVLNIENIDQSFDRYQVAAIRKENDSIADTVQLQERTINSETDVVTYDGGEQGLDVAFEEITINTASYNRAKTITEADNTIYMGNLSQSSALGYQKYANNIKVSPTVKPVEDGGNGILTRDHYGNPKISFYDKSFKRGEVYAFYIAFVLNNGVESEAFHIPGRPPEGNELNSTAGSVFEDIDPDGFMYQFKSAPGSNGMAYWENEGETYPTEQEDEQGKWEIYDVDTNGDPDPTGNSLHGEKVRHHHFPDIVYDPDITPFKGIDTDSQAYTLGIELSDVKIPASIIDQIRGVKIYYAKRTPQNKRILDQGFVVPMNPVHINASGFDDTFWAYDRASKFNETINSTGLLMQSFHSSRTRQNLGTAAYMKLMQEVKGDAVDYSGGGDSDAVHLKQMDSYDIRSEADVFHEIHNKNAVTYVERGGVTNATANNFSFDIWNSEGEDAIAVQLSESANFNITGAGRNTTDGSLGVVSEICAIRNNLYSPFDLQQLVSTGVVYTNMDRFDPRQQSQDATQAEGEIEITSGSADIPDQQANCSTEITSGSDTDGGQMEITYDQNTVPITLDGNLTIDEVGAELVTQINADGSITMEASYVDSSNTLVFTADDVGEDENGKTVNIDVVNTGVTVSDTSPEMSGGQSLDDILVDLDDETVTVDTPNDDTAENVAIAIKDAINNQSSEYSSTVDGAVVTVTAVNTGVEYNGVIDLTVGNTNVTYSTSDLLNGSDEGSEGQHIIPSVYGGDTYINRHGTRRTGWEFEKNPGVDGYFPEHPHRYLLEYVVESVDNIKMRHEGEADEQIYYPKSSAEDVLNIEDDFSPDINVMNYIEYNSDFSALATIKSAIPANAIEERIQSFPTRIIRSVQGDTNIGDDEGLRTFLENDFIDLTRKRGELVKLSVFNNRIIPHMQRSLIQTKGRQEMAVGDIRAFVGAGDIFAVDPDELISTDDGFAGLQDPQAATVTPYGYFFVDRMAGKVYLLSEQIQEISRNGLHNFFYDELTSIDSPGNLIASYDSKWDRILLTNTDDTTPEGQWTLSYYPQLQVWGCFHDYLPEYYLHGVNTFYTLKDGTLYEHNISDKAAEFYGSNQPTIIEFVDNRAQAESKHVMNIEFITEVLDSNGDSLTKETFDTFRIRNSYQDSGEQDIIYFTNTDGNARNIEGTWKINKFRDMLVNGTVDMNKPWYDQGHFIGKYTQVRLKYNNSDNNFLYLYRVNVGIKQSNR